MASAEQIKALLKSHIKGDDERFLSVAMQVAAHDILCDSNIWSVRFVTTCSPRSPPPCTRAT